MQRERATTGHVATRGSANPERVHNAFWEARVRTGETTWSAAQALVIETIGSPGWCFARFGMSRTRLPDGRIICVAGEHEDSYDPDFFIYNDVVVIHPDGAIDIYAYSQIDFPPTDFHTATLIGEWIYLIGSVGYHGSRAGDKTPVYRVSLKDFHIEPVETAGASPGWISRHRADRVSETTIRIGGGQILSIGDNGLEHSSANELAFELDVASGRWQTSSESVPSLLNEQIRLPPESAWQLELFESSDDAQEIRDAIMQEVGLTHPLFCGDFWPLGRLGLLNQIVVRFLDGTERLAHCEPPGYCGRASPEPTIEFFTDWLSVLKPKW